MNPMDVIVDRSPKQKAKRIDALRAELKELGYSVVATKYLNTLLVHAGRIEPLKRGKRAA